MMRAVVTKTICKSKMVMGTDHHFICAVASPDGDAVTRQWIWCPIVTSSATRDPAYIDTAGSMNDNTSGGCEIHLMNAIRHVGSKTREALQRELVS